MRKLGLNSCYLPKWQSQDSKLHLLVPRSVLFPLYQLFKDILSPLFRFLSVQFSRSVMSHSLWSHGLQHARPPCPSQTSGFTQTHVHWVGDVIQPSHPRLSPSPPAFNLSHHSWPHGLQHTRLPCPSPTPGAYSKLTSIHDYWKNHSLD